MSRITAVYARRDEPQSLVDDLRRNVAWCDDIIEVQRPREGGWNHEGETRVAMREALRAAGAEWTLWIDPDERLELRAEAVVREAIEHADPQTLFAFSLRELWTPTAWRVDGIWGRWSPTCRIFQLLPHYHYVHQRVHCSVIPYNTPGWDRPLDVVLYHLKNIEPGNRVQRRAAYLEADPHFAFQPPLAPNGWDFLIDETGLELREIEADRTYEPLYVAGSYHYLAPGHDLGHRSLA